MNLFKSGLTSPKVIVDAYNASIRDTIIRYGVPKDIVQGVFNIKDNYYKKIDEDNLSDASCEWLANFEASCDAVNKTSGIPRPLDEMYEYASHIRNYRRMKNGTKSNFVPMKDKYTEIVRNHFDDSVSKNFQRASSDRVFTVKVADSRYEQGYTFIDSDSGYHNKHVINLSLTWDKNVYQQDLDIIPNGKRNVMTLTLTPDPYKHLESEGIDCFRGNFIDIRFRHKGRGQYGYEFVPEYLPNKILLVKETSDGKMFGIGDSIHKAKSLLERRQNAKVMKSMLESV